MRENGAYRENPDPVQLSWWSIFVYNDEEVAERISENVNSYFKKITAKNEV